MNRRIPPAARAFAVAVAVACLAGTAAPAQDEGKVVSDSIDVADAAGQPKTRVGSVESADYEKVTFTDRAGGKKGDVPSSTVLQIRWGDAPQGYEDGVRALEAGDWAAAERGFADAVAEKGAKPSIRGWVDDFANAGLGRAFVELGQADKAVQAFAAARKANARSFVLDQILLGLARAEMARGDGAAAAKAADELIAAARTARRADWELEAHLVKADGKRASGDFAGAVSAYDDATRFAESAAGAERSEAGKRRLQRAALEAAVRKGWTMVAKGESTKSQSDLDAARTYFEGLLTKHAGDTLVLASASNAAGVSRLAAGDVRGALKQFMTTEVVHFRAADEVARSLWYQSECWKRLGDEKSGADRLKELKETYPGTEWARRAR